MNEGNVVSKPTTSRAARRAATQARILDAARQEFGDRGFEATTVRGIARRAGVDPSLVLQHYGSKSALFTAAIQLPAGEPDEAADHLADVLKVRAAALPPEMRALVRSMLTAPEASEAVRLHLDERIGNLAAGHRRPGRRATSRYRCEQHSRPHRGPPLPPAARRVERLRRRPGPGGQPSPRCGSGSKALPLVPLVAGSFLVLQRLTSGPLAREATFQEPLNHSTGIRENDLGTGDVPQKRHYE